MAVSAALTVSLSANAQQKYQPEYRLSTVLGNAFPWGQGGERWIELVKEKTQGRINIKMYPGTSLVAGEQTREFTAIRQGVIDLAVGSSINWSPQVKELNLFSLPFLMPDYAAIDALTQGEVGKDIFRILEKNGVVPLAWGENGYREVSNSKRPIRTPEDMKGLKFRVVGSPIFNETFTALGANPTQMSWADAQPALASGAVDGQAGFEGFELLKPTDDRHTWLVITRWADDASFQAWVNSPAFGHGHRGEAEGASQPAAPQVGMTSELWSYEIAGGSSR